MDLFIEENYEQILIRIERLNPNQKAEWGAMTCAQMLAHCSEVQEVLNGKELKNTPFFLKLFKGAIKTSVLSKKPFKKGSPSHPQYKIEDEKSFDAEKGRLLKSLKKLYASKSEKFTNHTLFGNRNKKERSWASYKHLDHHLRQFGV